MDREKKAAQIPHINSRKIREMANGLQHEMDLAAESSKMRVNSLSISRGRNGKAKLSVKMSRIENFVLDLESDQDDPPHRQ